MKKKYSAILSILIITIMSACGPAPTPTLTAEEISNTAIANAWIAITQTQAAIPTATQTLVPTATYTPQPTFTLLPTLPPVTVAVANDPAVATQDPCNQPPPVISKGTLVKAKFINKSGGTVNLSFGMMSPNSFGECVTYSYYMDKFDEPVVTILAGCYWGYAWVTGNEPTIAKTGGDFICLNDPAKVVAIWVEAKAIWLH